MKIKKIVCMFTGVICTFAWICTSAGQENPAIVRDWQAVWIGPKAQPPLALDGASWIWSDEATVEPTTNAPAGTRFFRREILLADFDAITSAVAVFAADNHFALQVNGKTIGYGDDWRNPVSFNIASALKPGRNEITVQAENDPAPGNVSAAGLIGRMKLIRRDGTAAEIFTDAGWQSSFKLPETDWKPVKVLGPLGMGPWTGINSASTTTQRNLWTCYRKSFTLAQKPKSAIARIAVDSKYWLWINGTLAVYEGGLKRGPNPNDTYFDEVDLSPFLKQGDNTIAALVWYWGKDGFSHKSSGQAGFLFELNSNEGKMVSDSSWRMRHHPAFGEAGNITNFRLSESSIHFDSRNDIPNWMAPGFDDRSWQVAEEFGRPPSAPWNQLWRREIPQWKDYGLKNYVNANELPQVSNGQPIKAQLPYNAQVTPWLRISAKAGQFIKIGTDNSANEIFAEYITKEGEQEFETPAWMCGHAVVYEIPAGVKIVGLKFRESGFNTEFTGAFKCDDDFYNQLSNKAVRTLYINMRDNFFDCPDRERAQWWGDIVIQLGQVFYTFDPKAHSLIRKCMLNLCNWQRPTKTLFSPIPTGNWNMELPQQMLASIGKYGFWTYYLYTGDRKTLENVYPHVIDYLSIWKMDGDGLIIHRSGENGWDWGDHGDHIDIRMLDQAWYCLALEGAASMARELGKIKEAEALERQRKSIIQAVNKICWTGNAYRDPAYQGATDDRAQGIAVVAGIADREKYDAIRKVLASEFHASPYMEKYILEALFQMGDSTAALTRMKNRYCEMVHSETSTLWELFSRGGTLNHAWTGGPLTLLNQHVAGVEPTSPGFATYQVRPKLGPLKNVSCRFDTIHGGIDLSIIRSEQAFQIDLVSPASTRATVCLPLAEYGFNKIYANGKEVWMNGSARNRIKGLKPMGIINGCVCLQVDPGQWSFISR